MGKFYDADEETAKQMNRLMEADGLFCLDWAKANVELYGSWRTHSSY